MRTAHSSQYRSRVRPLALMFYQNAQGYCPGFFHGAYHRSMFVARFQKVCDSLPLSKASEVLPVDFVCFHTQRHGPKLHLNETENLQYRDLN